VRIETKKQHTPICSGPKTPNRRAKPSVEMSSTRSFSQAHPRRHRRRRRLPCVCGPSPPAAHGGSSAVAVLAVALSVVASLADGFSPSLPFRCTPPTSPQTPGWTATVTSVHVTSRDPASPRVSKRARIKKVLDKARGRTGIRNGAQSPPTLPSRPPPVSRRSRPAAAVIAETAAMGGLADLESVDVTRVPPSSVGGASKIPDTPQDGLRGDVSAAFSMPPPPLPFRLPDLDSEQRGVLEAGGRVQFQEDMKREGSGFVVFDVDAPEAAVWDSLLDFPEYPRLIPTVRDVRMFTNTNPKASYLDESPVAFEDGTCARLGHGVPSVTRAAFTLSKFKLTIAAIHKYRPHPKGDYMIFTLDPACTNIVLQKAKGVWHTQSNPDGKEGKTRVWLLCELKVSSVLPRWIVDYAARRAMPRATSWLKPTAEAAAQLWLRPMPLEDVKGSDGAPAEGGDRPDKREEDWRYDSGNDPSNKDEEDLHFSRFVGETKP